MTVCPNCGSAEITFRYGKARWICGSHGHGADYFPHQTTVCELIRSLRDELAGARDAERDRIADRLELRASKLEDELAISETSTEIGLERILAVIKSLRKEAMSLRNNEHRSDT